MRRGRSRRHPVGRAVLWLANAAEALAGLAAAAALGAVVLTLPRTNDTAEIPGLSAPVSVGFDSDGIARIRATTELDGAAAIGFVHARDRMFQMELMRRAAAGTISELAGPRALPLDRTMRVLGVRYRAEQELAALPADTRAMLDAYARGVNAWLAQHGRFSSLQSVVLGRPAPWSALDSLLWGKTLGLYLSGNWREELARAGLLDRGAPRDKIDQLWPPQDDTPGPSASAAQPGEAIYATLLDRLIPSFPDPFTLPSTASNEWAVDGAHSTTGAPLLAGDPHLAYSKPGIWYLARIDTPTSTLVGATAPGVPFLVIGRNRDIAWTFTTAGADTQDVFIEQPSAGRALPDPDRPRRLHHPHRAHRRPRRTGPSADGAGDPARPGGQRHRRRWRPGLRRRHRQPAAGRRCRHRPAGDQPRQNGGGSRAGRADHDVPGAEPAGGGQDRHRPVHHRAGAGAHGGRWRVAGGRRRRGA